MKRLFKPLLLIGFGIVCAFPLFSLLYYTMARTSTPQFCAGCHEIVPAYRSWQTSSHVNNPQGIVANCMDCHLPPPENTIAFFYSKTLHGIKDIVVHVLEGSDAYNRAEERKAAYGYMENAHCQKCHRNLLHIPSSRGAMLAHRTVLYARPGYERKCVDCHNMLVHIDRTYYAHKQARGPYRAPGILFNSQGEVEYPSKLRGTL
ncbi:cytochrome c3 family protein [Desulfogranum japonicum]|uniref:cytochrome c3 family protein n=1 Tax=Desulfogranum japonicum TaxID=231447 RepID=UPI0003F83E69|nr:NapC/NirT family cytochrome c [Desulfogranum japonicum]